MDLNAGNIHGLIKIDYPEIKLNADLFSKDLFSPKLSSNVKGILKAIINDKLELRI